MKALPLFAVSLFFSFQSFAQSVVVSSYFNAADARDEWTELLVVTDNTDMRGWTIRDDNSSQSGWQTAVTFDNIAFWNNMRAGTIILLWHRPVASDGTTAHPSDVNKADGYIELDATNASYFSGGAFGTAPSWAGASLNIAGGGDVLQLRDASGTHVHALGHISSPGADWNALPGPKLNHSSGTSSGDAVYICPGNSIADYGNSTPQNGTTWTSKNSSTLTSGLPNVSASNPTQNTAFWDTLREPVFASQVIVPGSVIAGSPGSISFSWTAATDPNPSDGTTGYLILRNTTNTFTAPSDGTTYVTGNPLGSATIIAQLSSSATTTYTDNTVMNGNAYYYRVYAFRYSTDNNNGNSYHRSRGRAYTSTYADIQQANPLPVTLLRFDAMRDGSAAIVTWTTASETNNDFFTVERATDATPFQAIGIVAGNGSCSMQHSYSFVDEAPVSGNNYYRLRQTDFNGVSHVYEPKLVTFENESPASAQAWLCENGLAFSVAGWNETVTIEVYDGSGRKILSSLVNGDESGTLPMENATGIYFVRFFTNEKDETKKIAR